MVPMHPKDQHLLGVQWERAVYIDQVLLFRLQLVPKIFFSSGRHNAMDFTKKEINKGLC